VMMKVDQARAGALCRVYCHVRSTVGNDTRNVR
jgi:hypothetical protein